MSIQAIGQTFASQTSGAATTITVNVPSGTADGNLMILIVTSTINNTGQWNTPSGWTQWYNVNGRGIFYKTASSEPASYTATQVSASSSDAYILTYSSAAIDVMGGLGANASPTTTTAITTTVNDTYVFFFASARTGVSTTFTTPTGYTVLISESDGTAPSSAIFYLIQSAAGATGTPSSTPSGGATAGSLLFSIKPTDTGNFFSMMG